MSWKLSWRRIAPRLVKARAFTGVAIFALLFLGMSTVMVLLLSQLMKTWWSFAIAVLVVFGSLAPFAYVLGVETMREHLARVRRQTDAQMRAADQDAARLEKAHADGVPGRVSIAPDASTAGAVSEAAQPGALSASARDRKQTS